MSSLSIQELLEEHAERSKLLSAIEALSLAPTLTATEWVQRVSAVAAVTESELKWLNQDDRLWVQHAVVSYVKKALTELYPTAIVPPDDMKSALTAFTDWVARQDDRLVLDFVWAVMESFPRRGWTAWAWRVATALPT